MAATLIQVAVPAPLPQLFDYRATAPVAPGTRVLVPFGRTRRVGVVVGPAPEGGAVAPERIKAVLEVLDATPALDAELLATLLWTARYYHYPPGEAIETALPAGLREARPLPPAGRPALRLTGAGVAALAQPAARPGARTRRLLERLRDGPVAYADLDTELDGWRDSATALRQRSLVENATLADADVPRVAMPGPAPNDEQAAAIAAVDAAAGTFQPFLLEGVTGSGKTEVYLRAVAHALARGRQALVLVPEIGLTPQTLARFRERLGVRVLALHSDLADGERTRAWLAASRGEVRVILGTRSAVFTPLPEAGLIVVDEEHDASYKQQDGLRYSARDLALVRGRALNVPVLLGTATPSLESLANADAGRYRHLYLRARAGAAQPPAVRVVDMRRQTLHHGLGQTAVAALRACVARGEQALVFRNRRGYAPALLCHECGWHADCSRCSRPFTLHRVPPRLVCHHCGNEDSIPARCPECGKAALQPQGQGTERLELALNELLPNAPVVRVDRETTRNRNGLERALARLRDDEAGVYVGTQMLAKGHDLPNLTLVVVVGVDEGLFSVDFRAAERLGQLIVQVSGRAGRARKAGEVLLQTHHPDHPLLRVLVESGYAGLAQRLLAERAEAELPPHGHLALLRAEATVLERVEEFLAAAAGMFADAAGVDLHGPMPAPMPLRAGRHRGQLLLGSRERGRLHAALDRGLPALRALPGAARVRWAIDVDPIDLY